MYYSGHGTEQQRKQPECNTHRHAWLHIYLATTSKHLQGKNPISKIPNPTWENFDHVMKYMYMLIFVLFSQNNVIKFDQGIN